MSTLHITKKDNIHAYLDCDDKGTLMEIYEHFSRFVEGYVFTPAYKSGAWNGKIRFFNRGTGEIYLGIVNRVIEWCKENGVPVKVSREIIESFVDESITDHEISSYLENLNPSDGKGNPIPWRDYQPKAIKTIVQRKRRQIESPTSSGKSLIIYGACRYLIDRKLSKNQQILLVVPTISLIKQMRTDFIEYSQLNKWAAYDFTSEYGGGKKDDSGKIVIATYQSLFRKPKEWFERFNVMIVDEAHQAKAKSLIEIAKNCNAEYRIGLSGSFEADETTDLTISGIFGNKTVTTTTKKMIEDGHAAKLDIKCIQLSHQGSFSKIPYPKEMEYLATLEKRNMFINDLAAGLKGNTLILFQLVEKQGKPLYEILKKHSGKKVYFVYGGIDVDERERIRAIVEKEKDAIILASYQTFSTGVNLKNLENIIFASPSKSFTRIIQSIGRGLRLFTGKMGCTLYDLFDHLHGDKKVLKDCNYTFQHFVVRLKMYNKEGHPFTIESVKL